MERLQLFTISVVLLIAMGCGTTRTASTTNKPSNPNVIETEESALTLADYLKRVPGVQVMGQGSSTRVKVRGGSRVSGNVSGNISGAGSDQPLFVVDGTPVGNNYSEVQSYVDVNDIDRVEVLKNVAATSEYGMRGANGVVLIHTKKN